MRSYQQSLYECRKNKSGHRSERSLCRRRNTTRYLSTLPSIAGTNEELSNLFNCLVGVLVFGGISGGISGLSCWLALVAVKKSKENIVVPLTRANTAGLPAPDSLVRASQEPLQAQQKILLRPALETTERQEEELLRASTSSH